MTRSPAGNRKNEANMGELRCAAPAVGRSRAGPPPSEGSKGTRVSEQDRPWVLIVDDDPGVRETLRMQLRDLGYEVWTAEDGQAAIESLKRRKPDLVILDVIMPRKNGHEVLEWIRQNPATQNLPVIVLTAQNLTGNRVSMLTLGVDAYLQKSQGMEPLFQSVDRILNHPLN